jgi:hypothetical protein
MPRNNDSVRDAAVRLAERLGNGAVHPDDDEAAQAPVWWRLLASAAIFGDGLLSLPSSGPKAFSRPVSFLTADEIASAGDGDFVPVAWVDGGQAVAMVRDEGELPVVVVGIDGQGGAPVADSLTAFLDALTPQTVCWFRAGKARAAIELVGDRGLLVEHAGAVHQLELATDDEVGDRYAAFVAERLSEGMEAVSCPARLRGLIESYADDDNELPPERRAQKAIERLVAEEALELCEDADLEALYDDAGRFLEKNARVRDLGAAFAEWLTRHRAVDDLYADDDAVAVSLGVR